MNSVQALADFIKSEFPQWRLIYEPRLPDNFENGGVLVAPETIERIPVAGRSVALKARSTVALVTGKQSPSLVEPDLDSRLFEFIAAIEQSRMFSWDTAERTVIDEVGHVWKLSITHMYQISTPKE